MDASADPSGEFARLSRLQLIFHVLVGMDDCVIEPIRVKALVAALMQTQALTGS